MYSEENDKLTTLGWRMRHFSSSRRENDNVSKSLGIEGLEKTFGFAERTHGGEQNDSLVWDNKWRRHVTKNGEGIEASETKRVQEVRDEARPNGEKEALFKT